MKGLTIKDVPFDVMQVWVLETLGQPIGREMMQKVKQTIKDYPEWFPSDKNDEVPIQPQYFPIYSKKIKIFNPKLHKNGK
jgi:hypothetical protein